MYLKRLESVGFKSFAERIRVEFVPGVTAVVGPNGSGKSNITDAIRWVLGEQSAKSLRGSKMEDIIFQGSDTRRPLNVAEVTLVLNNHDQVLPLEYDEVSITRRVYRSGDSEFYINKQACRLKDIIDLFMDSGLGREAFSIISQGKVEEVLSSKPEERREIFEEAAGVLKYRQRKIKAEYKLTETKENMSRIEDIIYEIEQQMNPLFEQADTAKKYIEQSEWLKQQEISLIITEIEDLHAKWDRLLDELNRDKTKEIELKTAIQVKETHLESDRQNVQTLDGTIEHLQTRLLTSTQQLEQYEGKRQVNQERTKHFTKNKDKLEDQIKLTNNQFKELMDEHKDEMQKLSELKLIKQDIDKKIDQLNVELTLDIENIPEKIEEEKSRYIEGLNEQAAKRNEKQSIHQQLQQIIAKENSQKERFQDFLTKQEELKSKQVVISNDLSEQERNVSEKEKKINQLKRLLNNERKAFEKDQKNLYESYQTIAKYKSRKEMLEEMKESYHGFFHGVKTILKANKEDRLPNIHGAVIELIEVPSTYLTAVETILGGQAQHVIVTDDQAARKAISLLRETNNGRATFLPLQSIQPRSIATNVVNKISKHPGFIGIAANIVQTKRAYEKAIHHLMGNVVITKTMKDANEIAHLTMRKNRIVTIDGDVVNAGGSMSGGAKLKTNQSLFTREKDLEDVTLKLSRLQHKAAADNQQVDEQKKRIKRLEIELEQESHSLVTDQQKLGNMEEEYRTIEMELGSTNETLALYDQNKKQFEHDRSKLNTKDKQLTIELEEVKAQLLDRETNINQLTEKESDFKVNQEHNQAQLHQLQVSLAEQEERVRNQEDKVNRSQVRLTELDDQYKAYQDDLKDLLDEQKNEETEQKMNNYIKDKQSEIDNITDEIQQKRSSRSERNQIIKDQERELKEEIKQHHFLAKEIQDKEIETNRLDVDLENRLLHLQKEYAITFEKAKQTYEKTLNIEETKSFVRQLKQRIEQLGTVNLGAIDEYERISERYTFLNDQKSDLVEAQETLYSIIKEMDQVMKSRFEKTFLLIQQEFKTVFTDLFGGGSAKLTLTDEENILNTGIDIIAQPPGKKLQQLGLLSGGERSLTAIALLFSILRVRPVPFCVLDEVEASLDEANIVRFAKYLKLHSQNTQFIVITHRKGTMEEADVLYGVTMQESGVSRLVSVQLEQSEALVNS